MSQDAGTPTGQVSTLVGFVTGFGETVALVFRLFTGRLSYRTGRYWMLSIAGYLITVVAVPALAAAQALWQAAVLVVGERFGKAVLPVEGEEHVPEPFVVQQQPAQQHAATGLIHPLSNHEHQGAPVLVRQGPGLTDGTAVCLLALPATHGCDHRVRAHVLRQGVLRVECIG